MPPVVPKHAAPKGVDDDEEHDERSIDNGNLLPAVLEIPQDASLARLAAIAELGLVVRPGIAVRVGRIAGDRGLGPIGLVQVCEVAFSWGLAASRLQIEVEQVQFTLPLSSNHPDFLYIFFIKLNRHRTEFIKI